MNCTKEKTQQILSLFTLTAPSSEWPDENHSKILSGPTKKQSAANQEWGSFDMAGSWSGVSQIFSDNLKLASGWYRDNAIVSGGQMEPSDSSVLMGLFLNELIFILT